MVFLRSLGGRGGGGRPGTVEGAGVVNVEDDWDDGSVEMFLIM